MNFVRRSISTALLPLLALCLTTAAPSRVHAQTPEPAAQDNLRLPAFTASPSLFDVEPVRVDLRAAGAEAARSVAASATDRDVTPAAAPRVAAERRRSPGRIVLGASLGAVGGFFAGGYLGAKIDGDCGGCDDPGFKGFLIGAPIGAIVGGILGGKFF
jgi:hypothetical protein